MPVTSARTNSTFRFLRRMPRSGAAIFPSDRMPVAHWYSSGWNRWCSARSIRVTWTGARRSALAANSPAKPPPMITTRRWLPWSLIARPASLVLSAAGPSACRVVPGVPVGEQPVGLLRAPGTLGVGVDGHGVAEHRVDDLPGVLDGVLPGEQPALVVQRGADQPVVGTLVAAGLLGERQFLRLGLPAGPRLLAGQAEADRGLRPDPEPQFVAVRQRGKPEQVPWWVLEPDGDLGGGDRHALTGPDQDRHVRPPPRVRH